MSAPASPKRELLPATGAHANAHDGRVSARAARAPVSGKPYRLAVRVYYEDTDAAGVVYYANYLRFMERARTEWLAALGFDLAAVEREHGVVFAVHRADVEYRLPARLGDRLDVTVAPLEVRRASIAVEQEVRRGDEALTRARVAIACLDRTHWRPARIPTALHARLEAQL